MNSVWWKKEKMIDFTQPIDHLPCSLEKLYLPEKHNLNLEYLPPGVVLVTRVTAPYYGGVVTFKTKCFIGPF